MLENQSQSEPALESPYILREKDWRNGSIVYQVIVDRFKESDNIDAKKDLYAYPRQLRNWSETPCQGDFLPEFNVWAHEIDFWGGDLNSLRSALDYLTQMKINVLYLNPIHAAFTNHKYDASDYMEISPEYGSKADLQSLIDDVHQRGMRIVLDGVFNHVGRGSELFQEAASNPSSPHRDWFYFNDRYSRGVRLWANAPSLPELNYENPEVRDFIYGAEDSVVRSYLRFGIDGWRLDTAFELGFTCLSELTESAHLEKPGSLVVGEIWSYPQDWFPALDGVMNFTLRQILIDCADEKISSASANEMIDQMIEDAGIEHILKSWILLDNHDTPRITSTFPNPQARKVAQVLQFTLPGSPNLYYGSELGMESGPEPLCRAPMRWDLVSDTNAVFTWTKRLIEVREEQRGLKVGDYRKIISHKLIAFERYTDRVDDTVIVLANFSGDEVEETLMIPDSRLMNGTPMIDLLGSGLSFRLRSSILSVYLPARSAIVLKPYTEAVDGYTSYKRVDRIR